MILKPADSPDYATIANVIFIKWYKKYQDARYFTDAEAWMLFRMAAVAEAVGWTLLIIGIACKQLPVWWHLIPVGVAGVLHGILFLIYIAAVLVLAPSLGWSLFKTIVAGLFSMPPYGSLVFEKWAAEGRIWTDMLHLYSAIRYHAVVAATAR